MRNLPSRRRSGCACAAVAIISEIDENAHRRELPEVERAELIAEWIQLQKERKKKGKRKEVSGQVGPKPEIGGRPRGGINQAARDLGLPATTVKRAVRIASLSDAAKAEAKALGLDNNQSALLEAVKKGQGGGIKWTREEGWMSGMNVFVCRRYLLLRHIVRKFLKSSHLVRLSNEK